MRMNNEIISISIQSKFNLCQDMKAVLGITHTDLSYAFVLLHIPELRNLVLRNKTITERVMELTE
jgi:hypothetical protein